MFIYISLSWLVLNNNLKILLYIQYIFNNESVKCKFHTIIYGSNIKVLLLWIYAFVIYL